MSLTQAARVLRRAIVVCGALLMVVAFDAWSVKQAEAAQRLCCLSEWQPGGCTATYRRAAWCDNTCDVCGAFFCASSTMPCVK